MKGAHSRPGARSALHGDSIAAERPNMRLWYTACRFLCQAWFILFCRGRVIGVRNVPRTGGVLLACNHQSFFDPVLATLALPRECHYMARDSLFRNAAFRTLIQSLNAFPVKRGAADMAAVKESLRRLKSGALLTMFPEARRTPDGEIHPMQPGALLIARKAGVPIVPTLIDGAFEAWPRQAKFPRPGRIRVVYGEPITPEDLARVPEDEWAEWIRGVIVALRERLPARDSFAASR